MDHLPKCGRAKIGQNWGLWTKVKWRIGEEVNFRERVIKAKANTRRGHGTKDLAIKPFYGQVRLANRETLLEWSWTKDLAMKKFMAKFEWRIGRGSRIWGCGAGGEQLRARGGMERRGTNKWWTAAEMRKWRWPNIPVGLGSTRTPVCM